MLPDELLLESCESAPLSAPPSPLSAPPSPPPPSGGFGRDTVSRGVLCEDGLRGTCWSQR